ncbi:MAG: ester cyclase [Herpetosiphonaceae bacterium]|nr:ester cyclase [Herpetosiphonaceae bacterium]
MADETQSHKDGHSHELQAGTQAEQQALRIGGLSRTMPRDFTISLNTKGGTDQQLLNPGTQRRQSMRGFEEQYVDIIDYIVRITHRIWEEKDIGYIYDTYRHNSRVTDDYGLQYGRDKIVADTIHTVNAFPDIRLYADEIVWAGDDQVGFFTSHRTMIIGHNTGYSRYGPPTGKKIVVWCIANCTALENEIFEEWVLYNNSSMLAQLGFDLRANAREMGNQAKLDGLQDPRFGEAERLPGQGKPPHLPSKRSDGFDVEDFIRRAYHYIWNWRMLGKVDDAYASQLRFHGPTNRTYYGRGAYKSFILSMLAMFSDGMLEIDDMYWMGNEREGFLTSVRWHFVGTHRGMGVYGVPTGRQISMWGITQHRILSGAITEEWMLFNEFEVMQQIYRD